MIKNYLLKFILLFILVNTLAGKVAAQYAIGGTAGITLTKSVYWLTWANSPADSTLISEPAGASANNILPGQYVWKFSPTCRITATISNLTSPNGGYLQAYTTGAYTADGFNLMYSGNNLQPPYSRAVANSGLATSQAGEVTFNIDLKVAIYINNVWTNVVYPGMVIADAESLDSQGEYISAYTPNTIAWQLLNKRVQADTADNNHYKMQLANNGRYFKLFADKAPGNFGVQAVMFAHGAQNLDSLSMKGSGLTAMAIGFVLPFDLGDAPASYGKPGHYIDQFKITDYFAGDNVYSVANYDTTALVPQATVYIGANNVDPDGMVAYGPLANNDDITGNNDESSFVPANLPDIKVNQASGFSISVKATNTKTVPATLLGWVDFNDNGIFEPGEGQSVTVPAGVVNSNFTLKYPNSSFINNIKVGPLYARLRLTTSTLINNDSTSVDSRSTTYAADGEIEDYKLKTPLGVNISGTVFDDGNGGANGAISGTQLQSVTGEPLYAYLVNNNTGTVVNSAAVSANGTYSLPNNNNGNYTVAISTNNVAVGGTLSQVTANLPANWVPSGASYGTNNPSATGLLTGTPTLQVSVTTPADSLDVANVNFGLNQAPVATPDTAATNANTPVTVNPPSHDTDADGTLNLGSVLLVDPASGVGKTSVTVAGEGTFTVNTTTGTVTFTPVATFSGQVSPVAYTIKDNFGTQSQNALININVLAAALTGMPDTTTTPVNTPVTTNVTANDGAGAAGATVTSTNGTHGTTTVNSTGEVTYTPAKGYIGTDSYTYVLTKNGNTSAPIPVMVTVTPAGVPDTTATHINTPITTTVTANDGPSGIGATVKPTNGAHGTTTVNSAGQVTYTPNNGFTGTDTYIYTLTNNGLTSQPILVTVTVYASSLSITKAGKITGADNVGSLINYTLVVTNTGNTVLSDLVLTDAGADAGTLSPASIASIAPGASVTVTASHAITQADLNNGSYSNQATVTGKDPYGNTVTSKSDDPATTAVDDPTVVNLPVPGSINILKTGVLSANTINYSFVVTNTGKSVLNTVSFTDAKLGITDSLITPSGGLAPAATISFSHIYNLTSKDKAADSVSNTALVSAIDPSGNTTTSSSSVIILTDTLTLPIAVNDTAKTGINTPVIVPVLNNDNPGSSTFDVSSVGIVNQPAHGTVKVNADGTVTYTPNTGYTGTDVFTYRVKNKAGNYTNSATVTVAVIPAGVPDSAVTPVNTPVTTTVTANDGPGAVGATVTATNGANGTTTVNPQGQVTYTPANGYTGVDTYTYTLTSNGLTSAPIPVTVTVYSSSVSLTKTGKLGGTVSVGNVIYYTLVATNTGSTTLTGIALTDTGADAGTLSPSAIASLAPGASTTVTASHTITQADLNNGSYSNQAIVTGNDPYGNAVTAKSDDPTTVAAGDPTVTPLLTPGLISIVKTGVFSANYITFSFVIENTGTSVLNNIAFTDANLGVVDSVITPAGGLYPALSINIVKTYILTQQDKASGTVVNTASVSAVDLSGNTVTSNSTVSVSVPAAPEAVNDSATTSVDVPVNIPVLNNDNAGNSSFNLTSVAVVSPPLHGSVTVNPDGTVTYKPDPGYTGTDVFTYNVKDMYGYYTNTATVTVTIKADPILKVPTLFTPNGDGINDYFEIIGLDQFQENQLIIVNRWGNEVYKQTNYQNNWAGTGLNEGTYYYVLQVKNTGDANWKVYKGYTTLIRTFKKN
jgi:gliding motility-associated-like protein